MIRVVQWTTGFVGKPAVRAIVRHPQLELVGCFTHSKEKVGQDVGTLCGIDPIGVKATDDIDALIRLRPDCVSYMPLFYDVDHMVRLLEAGCNIVSTAYFVTGEQFGKRDLERIQAAAIKGKATVYGTGLNPGLANILGLVASSACDRIDKISVLESVDATPYESPGTWLAIGFGRPVDDPEAPALAERAMPSFKEAAAMMARALKVDLEGIEFSVEYAAATEDVDLGYMKIGRGCISGLRCCWSAMSKGQAVIELKVAWKLGTKLQPNWDTIEGWLVEIDGSPNVRCLFQPRTAKDVQPDILTAMPAIHAIEAVCRAPAGIVTADQLPMICAAHALRPA